MALPQAPAAALPWLDREVWMACAGPFASLPSVDEQVYYYPRGHSDQCHAHHLYRPLDGAPIPCRVSSVELGYHADVDDPFALITLQRDQGPTQPAAAAPQDQQPSGMRYFVRQLTGTSDDRCPFTVPKACAESLFPLLSNDNPSQFLQMLDVQGNMNQFKQLLTRGSNKLTTRWNNYFEEKRLRLYIDGVVFMRCEDGQLIIGSRRGGGPSLDRTMEMTLGIQEAAERAVAGDQFTVRYYPRQGWPFVVPRRQVDDALRLNWVQGMNVRMTVPVDALELPSSQRPEGASPSYNGVVTMVKDGNKWCKLQVNWDGAPCSIQRGERLAGGGRGAAGGGSRATS